MLDELAPIFYLIYEIYSLNFFQLRIRTNNNN